MNGGEHVSSIMFAMSAICTMQIRKDQLYASVVKATT